MPSQTKPAFVLLALFALTFNTGWLAPTVSAQAFTDLGQAEFLPAAEAEESLLRS
jgi:hypothetical protein